MRAKTDSWFTSHLLRIGNGTEETIRNDYVRLPEDIMIGYIDDNEDSINRLIQHVFPSLEKMRDQRNTSTSKIIISI
jgi:ATP-dependent DNA helicase PIF1